MQTIISLPAKETKARILSVMRAASKDTDRPILQTVHAECNGSLRLVAADGFRLALADFTTPCAWEGVVNFKAASLKAALPKSPKKTDVLTIALDGDHAVVNGAPVALESANYFDYRCIMPHPQGIRHTFTASAADLRTAFDCAKPFAKNAANITRLTLDNGTLTVEANDGENYYAGRVAVNVSQTDGAITWGANIAYLLDAVRDEPGDVIFNVQAPSRSFLVTGREDHLVMPMHLKPR